MQRNFVALAISKMETGSCSSAFCFQDTPTANWTSFRGPASGLVNIELTNTQAKGDVYKLVMYDDQDNSWPRTYDHDMSCEQRSSRNFTKAQVMVHLDEYDTFQKTIP